MTKPVTDLKKESIHIAWEYLRRTGELGEPRQAGQFLAEAIDRMVQSGTSSRLLLSNRAIIAYRNSVMPRSSNTLTIFALTSGNRDA